MLLLDVEKITQTPHMYGMQKEQLQSMATVIIYFFITFHWTGLAGMLRVYVSLTCWFQSISPLSILTYVFRPAELS